MSGRTAFVGVADYATVVRGGPELRSGPNFLRFWKERKGELVASKREVRARVALALQRLELVKLSKGALEEPMRLLEYKHVLAGAGVIIEPAEVSSLGSDKIQLAPGTFIYGKLDPDRGRVAITSHRTTYAASSEFVPLGVATTARPLFIQLLMLLPEARSSLGLLKAGKCQQRADVDKLLRCAIPLPSLEQQDALLKRVRPLFDDLEKTARRVPGFQEIIDRGLSTIFAPPAVETPRVLMASMRSMAAGPLLRGGFRYLSMTKTFTTMAQGVGGTVALRSVASVRGGKRVPRRTNYYSQPTGFRFLRASDVGRGFVKEEQLSNIDESVFDAISEATPGAHEVLLTVAGVVGKAAHPGAMPDVVVTDNVSLISPRNPDQIRPKYLMYLLLSSFMQFQFKKEMSELRQQKLSLEKIKSLRLPKIPDAKTQDDALEAIKHEFEEARMLKGQVVTLKRRIDALFRDALELPPWTGDDLPDAELVDLDASDEGSDEEAEEDDLSAVA